VEASWWGEWWGAGMVICLERGADLHMALLMPLQCACAIISNLDWHYLSGTGLPRLSWKRGC